MNRGTWRASLLASVGAMALAAGCAHRRAQPPPSPVVAADELLREGQFIQARKRYMALRDSLAGTPQGANAQYGLAYLNVFYRHPVPDWERALREFERFLDDYGEHALADEARTWVRVLRARQSLAEENEERTTRLEEAIGASPTVRDVASGGGYEVLLQSVARCYEEKDSLKARIRLLEEVIETIEQSP